MPKIPTRTSQAAVSTRVGAGPSLDNRGAQQIAQATKGLGQTLSGIGDMAFRFQEIEDESDATTQYAKDRVAAEEFRVNDVNNNGSKGHAERYAEFVSTQEETAKENLSEGLTGAKRFGKYQSKIQSERELNFAKTRQTEIQGKVDSAKASTEGLNLSMRNEQIASPDLERGGLALEQQIIKLESDRDSGLIFHDDFAKQKLAAENSMAEGHIEGLLQGSFKKGNRRFIDQGIALMEDKNSDIHKAMGKSLGPQLAKFRRRREVLKNERTEEVRTNLRDIKVDSKNGIASPQSINKAASLISQMSDPKKRAEASNQLRSFITTATQVKEDSSTPSRDWRPLDEIRKEMRGAAGTSKGSAIEAEMLNSIIANRANELEFQSTDSGLAIEKLNPEVKNKNQQAAQARADAGVLVLAPDIQAATEERSIRLSAEAAEFKEAAQISAGLKVRKFGKDEAKGLVDSIDEAEKSSAKFALISRIEARFPDPGKREEAIEELVDRGLPAEYLVGSYTTDLTKKRLIIDNIANADEIKIAFDNVPELKAQTTAAKKAALEITQGFGLTLVSGEESSGLARKNGMDKLALTEIRKIMGRPDRPSVSDAKELAKNRLFGEFEVTSGLLHPKFQNGKRIQPVFIETAQEFYLTPEGLESLDIERPLNVRTEEDWENYKEMVSEKGRMVNSGMSEYKIVFDDGILFDVPVLQKGTTHALKLSAYDISYNASPELLKQFGNRPQTQIRGGSLRSIELTLATQKTPKQLVAEQRAADAKKQKTKDDRRIKRLADKARQDRETLEARF